LISLSFCLPSEEFKVSLVKIKDNYIAGEPILIKEIVENTSNVEQIAPPYGAWYKESEQGLMLCGVPPPGLRPSGRGSQGEPKKYPQGYRWIKVYDLSVECNFTEPGNYDAYFKIKIKGNEYMKSANIVVLNPQ
jgi:hypothetical protein